MKIFLGVAIFVVLSFAIATPLYVHLHSAKVTAGLVSSPHIDNNGGLEVHAVTPQQGLSVQSPAPASVPHPAPIPTKSKAQTTPSVESQGASQALLDTEKRLIQQAQDNEARQWAQDQKCAGDNIQASNTYSAEESKDADLYGSYQRQLILSNDPRWISDSSAYKDQLDSELDHVYYTSANSIYGDNCNPTFPHSHLL